MQSEAVREVLEGTMRASRDVRGVAKGAALQSDVAEGQVYRLPLPPHPIAAEQARILVRLAGVAWNVGDSVDSLLLIATELATNALKIGEVFEIAVFRQGGTVLIEVWDSSEAAPDRQQQSVERVDGRGLLLVEACSKEWGWRLEQRGGKTVWAVCTVDTPDPAASEE
jgi:hypothetical protein